MYNLMDFHVGAQFEPPWGKSRLRRAQTRRKNEDLKKIGFQTRKMEIWSGHRIRL
jgi:hypothetical protein